MIRVYIFDLDGTLVDTEILWVRAVREYLEDRTRPVSQEEALQIVYGKAWSDVRNTILDLYPEAESADRSLEEILRDYVNRYKEEEDVVIHSSLGLLKRLAADYPVSIVSGSARVDVDDNIEMLGIGDLLDFSLASEDYPSGKPDPTCYEQAARLHEVPPEQCLVFEDSTAGIVAAKRAGMACVALSRANRPAQDTSHADLVLSDLAEFEPEEFTE